MYKFALPLTDFFVWVINLDLSVYANLEMRGLILPRKGRVLNVHKF